jgi:hypothetical protein
MEQFLAAVLEQGVLAGDEVERWQRELRSVDTEGRVMVAGRIG